MRVGRTEELYPGTEDASGNMRHGIILYLAMDMDVIMQRMERVPRVGSPLDNAKHTFFVCSRCFEEERELETVVVR